MRGNEFLDKMGLIDPAYVEAASAAPQTKKLGWLKKCGAIAACFVLLLSIGFGTYAYAAEIKEYNAAVRFFNDYDLSIEGLTRGEIKKVYRDITTKTFSYSKTAEVLIKSLSTDKITGYEILQENPTPQEIENLWKKYNSRFSSPEQNSIHYRYRNEYKKDSQLGFNVLDKSYLEKYDGGKLIWSASFSEFQVCGYSTVSDGVIAHGRTYRWSSRQDAYSWIAKIDESGNIIWKQMIGNEFHVEYIAKILENKDGSYAVISHGDFNYFCFSRYTADGKKTHYKKTEIGNYDIRNAVPFGDGYIVQIGNYNNSTNNEIIKVGYKGNITESFSYSSEDSYYYITDMIEFNGYIYLSAYAVPKLADENQNAGGRYEIASVLNYLFENDILNISSEKLTQMVRENYTAMLLICDPSAGTPQEFYSVKDSLGGKLSINDSGNLLWNVESITTAYFSPYTGSYTIGGLCHVFQYTFNNAGVLVNQEITDEVIQYHR